MPQKQQKTTGYESDNNGKFRLYRPDGTDSRNSGTRACRFRLLTTREAAHLLNVSTRTLQRMRSEQRIAYVVLRGKCRYRQSEIDRLLADCTVMEDAVTPKDLKHNHTLRTGGKPKGRRT